MGGNVGRTGDKVGCTVGIEVVGVEDGDDVGVSEGAGEDGGDEGVSERAVEEGNCVGAFEGCIVGTKVGTTTSETAEVGVFVVR